MFALVINLISANMLLLGYIISDTKYSNLTEDVVKVVKNESECKLNLPKLIIGFDNAKKYAKKHEIEFDILEHTFSDGTIWTFKKTEKRDYYEADVARFKEYVKKLSISSSRYYYINIYKLSYSDIKRLYNILINNSLNRDINYILIDNGMVYFSLLNNVVCGISLKSVEYYGINEEKIISKLKNGKNNKICFSTSKSMWALKDWFNGNEYVIPSILTNNTAL